MGNDARISIRFDREHTATAVRAGAHESPARVLTALSLPPYDGMIVVHGGAANMENELIDPVRAFFIAGLAPFAQSRRILIVDGGTQIGVPRVMGEAREHIQGTYPLLGVVPHRCVVYPGGPVLDGERIPLNPSHTHFIFVEGDEFGAESGLLVGLLRASAKPGLALIVNGGDIVLKEFGRRLQANTRSIDLTCRYGGEEFVVIMPDTEIENACYVAERLRSCIAAEPFRISPDLSISVTSSIGIACLESPEDAPETVLARADKALYAAKRDGRNRVVADAA